MRCGNFRSSSLQATSAAKLLTIRRIPCPQHPRATVDGRINKKPWNDSILQSMPTNLMVSNTVAPECSAKFLSGWRRCRNFNHVSALWCEGVSQPSSSICCVCLFGVNFRCCCFFPGGSSLGILWVDEILDHLRSPRIMIPLSIPTSKWFPVASKLFEMDFVHPQYHTSKMVILLSKNWKRGWLCLCLKA